MEHHRPHAELRGLLGRAVHPTPSATRREPTGSLLEDGADEQPKNEGLTFHGRALLYTKGLRNIWKLPLVVFATMPMSFPKGARDAYMDR